MFTANWIEKTKLNKKRLGMSHFFKKKQQKVWVVVVALLVERSVPTLEVRGLIPVIGNIYIDRLLSTVPKFEKSKIKDNETGHSQF